MQNRKERELFRGREKNIFAKAGIKTSVCIARSAALRPKMPKPGLMGAAAREHNWPECPLEVLELKTALSSQQSAFSQNQKQNLTADQRG